jgi:uncharacterized metal-binding protein YceD (DUF177 family)
MKETFPFMCSRCNVEVSIDVEPSYDEETMKEQGHDEGLELYNKLLTENHGVTFACPRGCGGEMRAE